ncbi:hypothetical protein LCGC14_0569770 [marine sediment metagenome]|uniref:Uncharacterized protein n=1 Tax=marine sediment metagenome TaxID=412755 RepID=A0A0F9RJG3_9ZZZZ
MKKVYVVEEKSGFRDWKPHSADKIKKASISRMGMYRELARIYRTNKHYRVRTYIAKEE